MDTNHGNESMLSDLQSVPGIGVVRRLTKSLEAFVSAGKSQYKVIAPGLPDEHLSTLVSHWDKWIFFVIGTILLLIGTYCITYTRWYLAGTSSQSYMRRTPIVPYWIPFVGSVAPFLWDPISFCAKLFDKFGNAVPVGFRLGPVKMYLVASPKHVRKLLKHTPELWGGISQAFAMKLILGSPSSVQPVYFADDSGPTKFPLHGSKVLPQDRMAYQHILAGREHILGKNGIKIGEVYTRVIERNVDAQSSITNEWTELPDLLSFVQREVFDGAIEAMCGTHLLTRNPTIYEDFFAFHDTIPLLMKGVPRWLRPDIYRKRDKILKMITEWHEFACEHSDYSAHGPNDADWDPYFGMKYIKARQSFLRNVTSMNAGGLAAEDLGVVWAATSNTFAVTFWTVFEVLRRPDLVDRIRPIIDTAYSESDIPLSTQLGETALFQSIFSEVARMRVLGIIPFVVTVPDYRLDGWAIPKNSILGIPSNALSMNEEIWNTGPENSHPLNRFWEERFLVYPNDPESGPLHRDLRAANPSPPVNKDDAASNEPVFSLKGLDAGYIVFGGGPAMCPGRHLARQETIGTLAVLLHRFDIEILSPKDWEPRMDGGYFPVGSLPPRKKDKVPFRIRLRQE